LLLYYITDSTRFAGVEAERNRHLLNTISQAAASAIDFIQLRERHLPAADLERLARKAVQALRTVPSSRTRLLINSRVDIALAAGADGVHLRSKDLSPAEVRSIWRAAGNESDPVVAVSCHSHSDVVRAAETAADFVVFGPVFEKAGSPPGMITGLDQLRAVCRSPVPVLALGGVSAQNACLCIQAGAAGIAGIRLFQQPDVAATIAGLRSLK
jgi:thiamine-phosphate pyrophosphorylase